MDNAPIQDNLTAIGYGAVLTIRRIIRKQIDLLTARLNEGDHASLDLFVALADDMIAVTESIPWSPLAEDVFTQLRASLQEHRRFIGQLPFSDELAYTRARAEIHEIDGILLAACDRLGRRLGLFRE